MWILFIDGFLNKKKVPATGPVSFINWNNVSFSSFFITILLFWSFVLKSLMVKSALNEFAPDYAVHPGEKLEEAIKARGMKGRKLVSKNNNSGFPIKRQREWQQMNKGIVTAYAIAFFSSWIEWMDLRSFLYRFCASSMS